MLTLDRIIVWAPIDRVFAIAAGVDRWPEFLDHYRWVRFHERRADGGLVEMAAWRPFGRFLYPTWWLSEMAILPHEHVVRYRHVQGITRGMDVEWRLVAAHDRVEINIVHEWAGPRWPLIGRVAANRVIGPVFIHHIASRTLAGVKRKAETA